MRGKYFSINNVLIIELAFQLWLRKFGIRIIEYLCVTKKIIVLLILLLT